jgi:hypothetical protein
MEGKMTTFVRRLAVCSALVLGGAFASTAVASADVIVPFQVNPAPYGNPNGSADTPRVSCAAAISETGGTVRITGPTDRPGCYLVSEVRWVNLSTGASGVAPMVDGVLGTRVSEPLPTGAGQVAVVAVAGNGFTVPGFATFYVP